MASSHLRLDHKLLDANNFQLNCLNGTLDLRKGDLNPHAPCDYLTRMINIAYDSNAKCPRWENFLNEIFENNKELIDFIHRALGYSITGDVSEQVFFICYGTGANGKSTLISIINMILGEYAKIAAPGLLMAKKHEAHPTEIADLFRARFVSTSEVKTDSKWDVEKIKMLSGGDRVNCRKMREDPWEYDPTFKIWILVNHRPTTIDNTYGFWRRVKMIPFTKTIPKNEQDPHLLETLKTELPGILAWLVRGCLLWMEKGLGSARIVDSATEAYRNPQNDLEGFLAACCIQHSLLRVQAKDLYEKYAEWCSTQSVKPLRPASFRTRMKSLGWETTKISVNYYVGLSLKLDSDETNDSGGAVEITVQPLSELRFEF